MASVGNMEIKEQRPSYVVFETRQIEDRDATIREGRYIAKDVHYAIVTPIGSKDRIPRQVDDWLAQLVQQAREERIPRHWADQYKQAYEAWKRGEAVPVNGTPIKGWPLLSPAQQANVISANVLTVEDLAQANDEAQRRIGMGARDFCDKAMAWLKSAKSTGTVAAENASLTATVASLTNQLAAANKLNEQLRAENKQLNAEKALQKSAGVST